MEVLFLGQGVASKGVMVLVADDRGGLDGVSDGLGDGICKRLEKRLKASNFHKDASACEILYVGDELKCPWIVVVKEPKTKNSREARILGAKVYATSLMMAKKGDKVLPVTLRMRDIEGEGDEGCLLDFLLGFVLRSWSFDKYKSDEVKGKRVEVELSVRSKGFKLLRGLWGRYESLSLGVALTRELVSEPPNVLYPETFAERLRALEEVGLEVEVKDEEELKKEGWGSLLSVSQGSSREARVVVMRWNGGVDGEAPLAFVGKGVTFDTGGISLKPAGGMEDMKFDMGGAGVVCGLMKALACRKARVNVVGVVGLVENMPSGDALRPSDVVTSLSGKTIEVLNTDAEGRLVLADVLWYVKEQYSPRFMVDLATLTGAMMVSLGTLYAGFFSNDGGLSKRLEESSKRSGDRMWRMPLDSGYAEELESPIADLKNIGQRWGGAITAAQFLEHFVGKTPWAHIDIAGVTWNDKGDKVMGKGATGFGVLLLDSFVEEYEKRR
jgi:leucyl aminopeptidase